MYDLFGKNSENLYKQWNIAIRHAFKLSNLTHRYLIEGISGCVHPKVLLCSRLCTFSRALQDCNKPSIRLLSNLTKYDLSTVYGRNLHNISQATKLEIDSLSAEQIKHEMKYFEVPDEEKWRPAFVDELLKIRKNEMTVEGFSEAEINDMLNIVCIS